MRYLDDDVMQKLPFAKRSKDRYGDIVSKVAPCKLLFKALNVMFIVLISLQKVKFVSDMWLTLAR